MPGRRRLMLAALGGGLGGLGGAGSQAAAPALRLGIAPFLSPAALLAVFRPLREQLAASLGQPVQLYTARDFHALIEAVRGGDYALALVPAHLARLAVQDWGWSPMAATVQATPVLVVVRGAGAIGTPADLAGQPVGMLDPLSLSATVGSAWITRQRLAVTLSPQPSINSALVALQRDELAAMVVTASQLRRLPPQTPTGQRVLVTLASIPGPQYIARPGLPAAEVERWRRALWAFRPDPAAPTTAPNSPLTPLTEAAMARVDLYAAELRRQLAQR